MQALQLLRCERAGQLYAVPVDEIESIERGRAGTLLVARHDATRIPVDRVQGIFARENGQGAFFTVEPPAVTAAPEGVAPATGTDSEPPRPPAAGKGRLKLVK